MNPAPLTRDVQDTTVARVRRDPAFAQALLAEAATLFLNGEADTARLVLRDLVDATMGFGALAAATGKPAKSLHRMLSKSGNPTMDNLAAILGVLRKKLRVEIQAHTVEAAYRAPALRPRPANSSCSARRPRPSGESRGRPGRRCP